MKCSKCSKEYPSEFYFESEGVCRDCFKSMKPDDQQAAIQEQSNVLPVTQKTEESQGFGGLCIVLGVLFGVIGIYFLILDPSGSPSDFLGHSVANLHRITIGQTASIVGAIFLAVGIRPR